MVWAIAPSTPPLGDLTRYRKRESWRWVGHAHQGISVSAVYDDSVLRPFILIQTLTPRLHNFGLPVSAFGQGLPVELGLNVRI